MESEQYSIISEKIELPQKRYVWIDVNKVDTKREDT